VRLEELEHLGDPGEARQLPGPQHQGAHQTLRQVLRPGVMSAQHHGGVQLPETLGDLLDRPQAPRVQLRGQKHGARTLRRWTRVQRPGDRLQQQSLQKRLRETPRVRTHQVFTQAFRHD